MKKIKISIENIHPSLHAMLMQTGLLIPDPLNPRQHNDKDLQFLAACLVKWGQRKPVICQLNEKGEHIIRAGNGLWEAATKLLNWKVIAAITVDEDDVSAMAFGIVDNRSAELSRWDYGNVAERLKELQIQEFDINTLGWEPFEIEPLLQGELSMPETEPELELDNTAAKKSSDFISIAFTKEQWETVSGAVNLYKEENERASIQPGEAITEITQWYMQNL